MPPEPKNGHVREILIAEVKGAPMSSVAEVEALARRGLVGDRNFSASGAKATQNVTLIESEKIDAFCKSTGLAFSARDARRNIVTRGIELNPLVGSEFMVGTVQMKALELCEPCSLLAKRTNRAVLWGLLHRGGLRCQILSDGLIRIGDSITGI